MKSDNSRVYYPVVSQITVKLYGCCFWRQWPASIKLFQICEKNCNKIWKIYHNFYMSSMRCFHRWYLFYNFLTTLQISSNWTAKPVVGIKPAILIITHRFWSFCDVYRFWNMWLWLQYPVITDVTFVVFLYFMAISFTVKNHNLLSKWHSPV